MKRLAIIALLTGLTALAAEAQTTKTKTKSKTSTSQAAKTPAADPWGTEEATPAAAPATTVTTTTATDAGTQNQASGADAGGFGGYGGFGAGADRPARVEGMSVAPGSPLQPGGRVRSDYMGRPIQSKPSMRPRSNRDQNRF